MLKKYTQDESCLQTTRVELRRDDILSITKELLDTATLAILHSESFAQLSRHSIQISKKDFAMLDLKVNLETHTAQFRWVDGILVQALERGYWLHLENVNLCSSSVLDRLNPLMEPDGVLLLSECGIKGKDNPKGKSRVVKPHPNFRLFLSMNSARGEVSRAMRNRCIEISLLSPKLPRCHRVTAMKSKTFSSMQVVDTLDILGNAGVASPTLANCLIASHVEESTSFDDNQIYEETRMIKEWARASVNAVDRGFTGDSFKRSVRQTAYGTKDNYDFAINHEQLILQRNIRNVLGKVLTESIPEGGASLLKMNRNFVRNPQGLEFYDKSQNSDSVLHGLDCFAPSLEVQDIRSAQIRNELIGIYISFLQRNENDVQWNFCEGYFEPIKKSIRYLTSKYKQISSASDDIKKMLFNNRLLVIHLEYDINNRTSQMNYESNVNDELSIAEVSYCIFQNKIDRSCVKCQIIPIIHPLFLAIDALTTSLFSVHDASKISLKALEKLLVCRDCLWLFFTMKTTNDYSEISQWFHEPRFLVHWNWLKKSLSELTETFELHIGDTTDKMRYLDLIMSNIDKALLVSGGDTRSLSNKFWKGMGHPIAPPKASDWLDIFSLRQDDSSISILDHEHFDFVIRSTWNRQSLSLSDLIEQNHPSLSIDAALKFEMLSAQCMSHWSSTDETTSSMRNEKKNYDIFYVNRLVQQKICLAKESMINRLKLHAIDSTVHMDSNKLDVDELQKLQDQCQDSFDDDGTQVMERILSSFGSLQMMPLVEYWCLKEEIWIIENLTWFIINDVEHFMKGIQREILPRLKVYIQTVIHSTVWPVYDLRPYQTLL